MLIIRGYKFPELSELTDDVIKKASVEFQESYESKEEKEQRLREMESGELRTRVRSDGMIEMLR